MSRLQKHAYKARCGNPSWLPRPSEFLGSRRGFHHGRLHGPPGPLPAASASGNTAAMTGTCRPPGVPSSSERGTSAGPVRTPSPADPCGLGTPGALRGLAPDDGRGWTAAGLRHPGRSAADPPGSGVFTLPRCTQTYAFVNADLLTGQRISGTKERPHSSSEEVLAHGLQSAEGACRVQPRPPQDVPSGRTVIPNLRQARPCRLKTNSWAPPLTT